MMRSLALAGAAMALTVCAGAASATVVDINFDTLTVGATVDNAYNGGTDSLGESATNYGVAFTPGDWVVLTGYGESSPPNFAYSASGAGMVNVAGGFIDSVSFTFGDFVPSTVSIYSGLNGTGTLLTQVTGLSANPTAFAPEMLSFAGTGESIVISSGTSSFGWDDLTLDLGSLATVPDPATWLLMLMGVGSIGAGLRVSRRGVGLLAV